MLETIIIVLVALWLLGLVIGGVGHIIHILLVAAVILVVFRLSGYRNKL